MGDINVIVKNQDREVRVSITNMENKEIMIFLKELLGMDTVNVLNGPLDSVLSVTKVNDQSMDLNVPRAPQNLLEPQEITSLAPKGTFVKCIVDCPKCKDAYERTVQAGGGPAICRSCKTPLYNEPGVNGFYKAVTKFTNN